MNDFTSYEQIRTSKEERDAMRGWKKTRESREEKNRREQRSFLRSMKHLALRPTGA